MGAESFLKAVQNYSSAANSQTFDSQQSCKTKRHVESTQVHTLVMISQNRTIGFPHQDLNISL